MTDGQSSLIIADESSLIVTAAGGLSSWAEGSEVTSEQVTAGLMPSSPADVLVLDGSGPLRGLDARRTLYEPGWRET